VNCRGCLTHPVLCERRRCADYREEGRKSYIPSMHGLIHVRSTVYTDISHPGRVQGDQWTPRGRDLAGLRSAETQNRPSEKEVNKKILPTSSEGQQGNGLELQ
jgi:hypothetical protein